MTLRSIIFGGEPILLVTHDCDDDGWQFLDGRPPESSNAATVGLGEVVRHDPSVLELADMPPGWRAWRDSPGAAWQRSKTL